MTTFTHDASRLKSLVKTLTHQQIRDLHIAIEEVDLHCDIVAQLPLDISLMILQYLPLYQVFQARRVSSKWKQLLSPAQTVEALLRDWYPKGQVGQSLQIPAGLCAESVASLKAEHIDAYRTGYPFNDTRHKWGCLVDFCCECVAYADGTLAFVVKSDSHSHFVKAIDLKTGEEFSSMPETRTRIHAIAMSSSMVAILGSDRCHVWNYRTGFSHHLQFPSGRQAMVAVSGESLAVFLCPSSYKNDQLAQVLTWTMKDQKTSSFSVAFPPKEDLYSTFCTMLDSKGETLVLFERVCPVSPKNSMEFRYVRTKLDGGVLAQGVITVSNLGAYQELSVDITLKETNADIVVSSYVKGQPGKRDISELLLICYNFYENRLEVREQVVSGLRTWSDTSSNVVFYKDVAHFLERGTRHCRLSVINLQDSTCSKAKIDFSTEYDQRVFKDLDEDVALLGDEIFLIAASSIGFRVWCFDANVQMANEDITYKEERKSRIKRQFNSKYNKNHLTSDDSSTGKSD